MTCEGYHSGRTTTISSPLVRRRAHMSSNDKLNLARCPACQQVIDATSTSCRFCGFGLSAAVMQEASAAFRASLNAKSRKNDRRALRAAIVSLIALVVFVGLWLTAKMLRFESVS